MRTIASGLIFDNLLGRTVEQLRVETALYGIVYDSIAIPDTWFLTNRSLQTMLLLPDGVELLRSGVIKPVLNESAGLAQRHQAFVENPALMHGFHENAALVQLVEEQTTAPLFYKGADVGANYKRLWAALMNEAMMSKLGLTEQAIGIVHETFARGQAAGKNIGTNTFVKDEMVPLIEQAVGVAQAELLMEIARAPYSLSLPTLYGYGVVAPAQFRGHEILRELNLKGRSVGELIINAPANGQFRFTINNRLVSWLLSHATLASITPAELAEIRGNAKRPNCQQALGRYLQEPNQENWTALSNQLEAYLADAAEHLFNSRLRRDQIKSDPETSDQVSLEGLQYEVKIDSGNQHPLNLSDLPASAGQDGEAQEIQIVGRSNVLPVDPTV